MNNNNNRPEQLSPKHANERQIESNEKHRLSNVGYFPWPSLLLSLVMIALLIINSTDHLNIYYQLPAFFQSNITLAGALVILGGVYLLDVRIFLYNNKKTQRQLNKLQKQLDIAWQSKKSQQQKAITFSSHTEKLKSFISDKLLEFIEYDEKYLHFKGIAAEVRHNGVICYDKVLTALSKAVEQQHFLSIYEQSYSKVNLNDDSTSEIEEENSSTDSAYTLDSLSQYQNAIDAMRYLWDLLDLSTADNIAIHIGNQLIESEENYYQLNLDTEKKLDITQKIPLDPTFSPTLATLMCLNLLTNESELRNLIALVKINPHAIDPSYSFENEQYRIGLEQTPELLGNPNHVILLLENLIKNALFFSSKSRYKQESDRVVIRLENKNNYARFSVYNRGPLISEDNFDNLFKLGFSTRRSKAHHGKGLGLYFVKEIVQGYQGKIVCENVVFTPASYHLLLTCNNGESHRIELSCETENDRVGIGCDKNIPLSKQSHIKCDHPVCAIEISDTSGTTLFDVSDLLQNQAYVWTPLSEQGIPQWTIQLRVFKKQHELTFKPLDVSGVLFRVDIPTAQQLSNS